MIGRVIGDFRRSCLLAFRFRAGFPEQAGYRIVFRIESLYLTFARFYGRWNAGCRGTLNLTIPHGDLMGLSVPNAVDDQDFDAI